MIIISSRKFRDSQSEYLKKALEEDVILTTLHYGNFKLVPIIEGEKRNTNSLEIELSSIEVGKKTRSCKKKEAVEVVEALDVEDQTGLDESHDTTDIDSPVIKYRDLGSGKPGILQEDKTDIIPKPSIDNTQVIDESKVYVDPALYDAFPEEYAKELEQERIEIDKLRHKGIKGFINRIIK